MKLFTLPNLVSHVVTETDDQTLSVTPNPRPGGLTKDQFREWCVQVTTQGKFISAWEGGNPHARIDSGNAPRRLHGIVADYDSTAAMSKVGDLFKTTGHLPMWVIETHTPGKCRLVWAFEKPVDVTHPDVTENFLKELNTKLKISDALPGFDKCSWTESQYFEMGTSPWNDVSGSTPVPSTLLAQCVFEGGLKAKVQYSEDPVIPMDVIAAEVERQFPGRWKKSFEEGQRGPLFWIDDGIEREGCVVTLNGMVCYSDRAGSNFLPWRAVLGKKFVDKFEEEQTGKAAEMFYFDGRTYWSNSKGDRWVYNQKEDARLLLKTLCGCSDRPRKGQSSSEIDKIMSHVITNRRVDGAVPILFEPDETMWINGNYYLNTSTTKAMPPAEDGDPKLWPWIHNFIHNAFDGDQDGIPAHLYFLGWLRRFWLSAYNGKPSPGQVIIIAGEAHTGKSFINRWLIGECVGGSVGAEDILMKQTSFNKAGAEVALWRCDDAASEGDWQTRQLFAKSLKAMAANPTQLYQPKFKDAIEIPFRGRVCVTCNTDPESLRVLPPLDATIKDKIMLFRIRDDFRPEFFDSNYKNEAMITTELPHFLRWLFDWTPPEEILDKVYKRFEIKSFHHHDLVTQAQTESNEYIFSEYLEMWMEAKRNGATDTVVVEPTVTELHSEMMTIAGNGFPYKANQVGHHLKKLLSQKMVPELIGAKKPRNKSVFVFKIKPKQKE